MNFTESEAFIAQYLDTTDGESLFHHHGQLELRWALSEDGIKDAIFRCCGVRFQDRVLGWKLLSDYVHLKPPTRYIMPQHIMAYATSRRPLVPATVKVPAR